MNAIGDATPCGSMGTTGVFGTDSATAAWDTGVITSTTGFCGSGTGACFCDNWDPASHVTYNSSTDRYYVDGPWFDEIVADPRPLVQCDSARVQYASDRRGTGYAISDASSTDLLYELGLRNGELVSEINGHSVASFDDGATVMWDLYYQGVTDYTVTVTSCGLLCGTFYRYYTLNYR